MGKSDKTIPENGMKTNITKPSTEWYVPKAFSKSHMLMMSHNTGYWYIASKAEIKNGSSLLTDCGQKFVNLIGDNKFKLKKLRVFFIAFNEIVWK